VVEVRQRGWGLKPVFKWVRVLQISELAERTYILRFEEPESAAVIQPGQFCMISPLPGSANVFLPRPFSYYRVISRSVIEILFRTFGRATRWMANLAPGDEIGVFGPLGNAFNLAPGTGNAVLVGGGIGIPPIVMLAGRFSALGRPPRIDLVYGESTASRVIDLAAVLPPSVRCHLTTEDGSAGLRGLVTAAVELILKDCRDPLAVYTCGPKSMMGALSRMLDSSRVALFEASCEENMACGMGICQGCVIPVRAGEDTVRYLRCCTEGPVFNGFEVQWR